jgi:hypothetical protein
LIVGAKAAKAAATLLSVGAEAPKAATEGHSLVSSEASVDDEERDFDLTNVHELVTDDCTVGQFVQRLGALHAREGSADRDAQGPAFLSIRED